jgi:hypothetical protein
MAILKNTTIDDTGFLRYPIGTTAQRPSSPLAGMIRFNTSINNLEYYNGTSWVPVGTQLVTDGLVLHLDAGNTSSYPGSGTTWYDISGSDINFTMVGGVTYTAGYFTNFTEATNYFEISSTANMSKLPLGSASRTLLSLCRTPTTYHPAHSHIFHYGTDLTDQSFGASITSNTLATHPWNGSPVTNETIPTGTDQFLGTSYTQSSSLHRFFKNGIELSSSNAIRAINTGSTVARVGSRVGPPTELWQTTGRIAVVLVYNRVLSTTEILQNFNVYRGRVGI